jgi:ATP/maltotriose-dependent transcriptional regulator MalT
MLRTLLLAATAMLAGPAIAYACGNEVEITTDDLARRLARAEKLIEEGKFRQAKAWVGRRRMPTAALQRRAEDLRAVLALRMDLGAKAIEAAAKHFRARLESGAGAKDVRYRAWLGEALVALGETDEARTLLGGLHEFDLVPDAYAYLALAKLSTGAERYNFWKACRTRTTKKHLCELPTVAASPGG